MALFFCCYQMPTKRLLTWLWLIFLLALPVTLLLLPADFFDEGEAICPSKRFFDVECLGCGMTRAVMHLLHLDFDMALYYNPGSFVVVPILGLIWLKWLWTAVKDVRSKHG